MGVASTCGVVSKESKSRKNMVSLGGGFWDRSVVVFSRGFLFSCCCVLLSCTAVLFSRSFLLVFRGV